MKGEIDNDFYCAVGLRCSEKLLCQGIANWKCKSKRLKWPTPKQFKHEYGVDYPEDAAVYVMWNGHWENIMCIDDMKDLTLVKGSLIVCACTPWGKPPADWRPV